MKTFLFSVDLEEFTVAPRDRDFRRTPLPELAERFLAFLRAYGMRSTFFVVGEIAEAFPEVIRAIEAEGHELGCHTHTHRPLSEHTPATLRDDLRRNLDALHRVASGPFTGFRAPILSLTEKTRWAYEVLAGLGFTYSSSVLPAANPLHGWPGFGEKPRMMEGITELPVTLAPIGPVRLPVGAGTYFRCLPFALTRRAFARFAGKNTPVVGYLHPYDCDPDQQWVMNPGVRGSRLMNALLYFNRSRTLSRLHRLAREGYQIFPYREYLAHAFPDAPGSPR